MGDGTSVQAAIEVFVPAATRLRRRNKPHAEPTSKSRNLLLLLRVYCCERGSTCRSSNHKAQSTCQNFMTAGRLVAFRANLAESPSQHATYFATLSSLRPTLARTIQQFLACSKAEVPRCRFDGHNPVARTFALALPTCTPAHPLRVTLSKSFQQTVQGLPWRLDAWAPSRTRRKRATLGVLLEVLGSWASCCPVAVVRPSAGRRKSELLSGCSVRTPPMSTRWLAGLRLTHRVVAGYQTRWTASTPGITSTRCGWATLSHPRASA